MKKLTKQSTSEEIRLYFEKILQLSQSNQDYPINLEEVYPLAYSRKDYAIRDLNKMFLQDIDYQVFLKKEKNPKGGRPTAVYYLSVSCLEYFIARKIRPVFEVYRQVFHQVVLNPNPDIALLIRERDMYKNLLEDYRRMLDYKTSTISTLFGIVERLR